MAKKYVWLSAVALGATVLAIPASGMAQPAQVGLKYSDVVTRYGVAVPMADGAILSATVVRPADEVRHPAVFVQTPYGRDGVTEEAASYARRGYAYIVIDVRGRHDSDGVFSPFHDASDGTQALDWIAKQPWSDGRVITVGASYGGNSQWNLWRERNPHQIAAVPYVAPADGFGDFVRFNGVPRLDLMFTWIMQEYERSEHPHEMEDFDWHQVMAQLPLDTLGAKAGRDVPAWRDWMRHSSFDDYWRPLDLTSGRRGLDIPTFNVTGWYEGQLRGDVRGYEIAGAASNKPMDDFLVIGPWLHVVNRDQKIGDRDGGPSAIINLDTMRDRWMDYVVFGKARPSFKNFVYFVPGLNAWRQADAFPIPQTRFTEMRLDSDGRANGNWGGGRLSDRQAGGPADLLQYDPANPVPSLSSRAAGARSGLPHGSVDHRSLESRNDVLVYTGAPLENDMEVTGPVKAQIFISTDVVDTDVVVRLMDVYPDGRSLNIAEGIARAKYRDGGERPMLLRSGEVYRIPVEMFPTSNYYRKGHRIRVEITSSDFPVFARNLNVEDSDTGTAMKVAHTHVYHSARYPSSITLPIVPAGASIAFDPPPRANAEKP